MILPNASNSLVDGRKLTSYLLDRSHPAGGGKAAFFIRFGFSKEKWEELADELIKHAQTNEVSDVSQTEYGTRFAVDGPIRAPDGTSLNIRSAWFIDFESDIPRLVTAHPLPRS